MKPAHVAMSCSRHGRVTRRHIGARRRRRPARRGRAVTFDPTSTDHHIRSGKLRGGDHATRQKPDIPTLSDFVPGYEASSWYGIGAPKNTPPDIVDKLNKEINAGLADPRIKARFADLGGMALSGSPADFGKLIAEETEKWGKVIRAANIKVE